MKKGNWYWRDLLPGEWVYLPYFRRAKGTCAAFSPHNLLCTRQRAHTGRHHACGGLRDPVFEVWR